MINYIKGKLVEIQQDSIIVECSGIGYEIFCTASDSSKIIDKINKEILVKTYLIHKEDAMILYGFLHDNTKQGFLTLLKVSGIGPKQAIKILSHFSTNELYRSIESEDINSLKSIQGIGPKMAKKIIFDLKGSLPHTEDENEENISSIENDLLQAMINMGYKEQDIKTGLKELRPFSDDFESNFKKLLKKLAGR